MSKIQFRKVQYSNVFGEQFNPWENNNVIDFKEKKIAVIYGPNGTGKTSFIHALENQTDSELLYDYDGDEYKNGSDVFHIIKDQNDRNIIEGNTQDFLLGDNIRREVELAKSIDQNREKLRNELIEILKEFNISKKESPLLELVKDDIIKNFLKALANTRDKGKLYTNEAFIAVLVKILECPKEDNIVGFDSLKLNFLAKDYIDKNSILQKLEKLNHDNLVKNPKINEIEENSEAIRILKKFNSSQCIVCDTKDINRDKLIETKSQNREKTLKSLDKKLKEAIESIIPLVPKEDPFEIKKILLETIKLGNVESFDTLRMEIDKYKAFYATQLIKMLNDVVENNTIITDYDEYKALLQTIPEITEEDYLYIEQIISNGMNKPLSVKRDKDNNNRLRICLDDIEVLHTDRKDLHLSTGEQNFLSLSFEFLKAKNSKAKIIAIDDPISSFDSIYKNKVVFAIVKILEKCNCMIFTHNLDLVRLLNAQFTNSFEFYIFNNTVDEEVGFIPVSQKETAMLLNVEKLVKFLQCDIFEYIQNEKLFLMAVIPFMRGYAHICLNDDAYESLNQLMHGYKTEKIDLVRVYTSVFKPSKKFNLDSLEISVDDILNSNFDNKILIDGEYSLLNKTLFHSLTYLYLRLKVEKALIEKFGLEIQSDEYMMLGTLINKAFNRKDKTQIHNRVFLTSKKTLLNEFNHYEGNLSIFQPAIDITDDALEREKTDILSFVENL